MSIDPIQLILAARPKLGDVPGAGDGVAATQGETRRARDFEMGDLDDLSALPGSPGHAAKMAALRKQAIARGDPEEIAAVQEPTLLLPQGTVLLPEPEPLPVLTPPSPTKRVAIYYGKNDTYNVAVESAPEWDTDEMFRGMNEDEARLLMKLAGALGIKVSDKTGDFS